MRMRVRNRVRFIRKNSEKKKTFRTFFYFFCKTIYIIRWINSNLIPLQPQI